ncbi:EOGT family protein [Megaselia abdita]
MLAFELFIKFVVLYCVQGVEDVLRNPNLPKEHLSFYYNTFPDAKKHCLNDKKCVNRDFLKSDKYDSEACWGFEEDCGKKNAFQRPECAKVFEGQNDPEETFYSQADFGYVKIQKEELQSYCKPKYTQDSSLVCTKYLRYCKGRHIMIDFIDLLNKKEPLRYDMDVLSKGQITGHCKLQKSKLNQEIDHLGALQSWAPELRFFEEHRNVIDGETCDVVVKEPTYIMKIDATYNMYHHFCDFFNLYMSLFLNQSQPDAFQNNRRILIWETYNYDSPFADTFKAFTDKPVWTLNSFKGKKVCFETVVLPLLPRLIFGLYYNTPLISGCEKSGVFRAFSEFVLHRLEVPKIPQKVKRVRVTILIRRTKYRQILNVEELLDKLYSNLKYDVRAVSFERGITFKDQLKIVRNTDVLIGMHGAGLTHLLFLPNWATLFELYHCEDPNCYKDLSRLRGINYITWEDDGKLVRQDSGHHPEVGAHAKFTNYSFDKDEFARLVEKAANSVLQNQEYRQFIKDNRINDEL